VKRVELIKAIEGLGCVLVRHGAKHAWYPIQPLAFRKPYLDIERLGTG
jgi:hypothetical protein